MSLASGYLCHILNWDLLRETHNRVLLDTQAQLSMTVISQYKHLALLGEYNGVGA
jgi:hypothetical protein